MDICMAADENYAMILRVVMISIIKNNEDEIINFHIFESGMREQTKQAVKALGDKGVNVVLYDIDREMSMIKSKIRNDWADNNSYVAYARLYIPYFLPNEVERFLYLDCDTLVISQLKELFDTDLGGNVIAGVKDVLPVEYKNSKGLKEDEYINSGILLVDNQKWKSQEVSKDILEYCEQHPKDLYPDQDAINIVLRGKIKIVHPKYCVFLPEYSFDFKDQVLGYGDDKGYYGAAELKEAKERPIIFHFVDTVLGRPWQSNNINPYAEVWLEYFNAIKGSENYKFEKKIISKRQMIFRVMYKIMPKTIFAKIYYYRRNREICRRMR